MNNSFDKFRDAVAQAAEALVGMRYEMAVNRDSMLTNAEFNVYIDTLMWAEEKGLA